MKKFLYASFFIALNILYLIIELSFNAYLLDVSASMSLLTDLTHLELYGRSISAAGATLLFWRLLIPYKQGLNIGKTLLKFLVITLIVFPTVFMGQKKLIDHLVESSSAEMRRSAEVLNVLKYGVANGFVKIDQLALDEITLETAAGKMFVVLAGLLIYSSDEELEKIEKELDVIARYATTTQQIQETQTRYRNYQYASLKIREIYSQYAKIVEDYDKQQQLSHQKSIEIYQQAIQSAMSRWATYRLKKQNLIESYQQKDSALGSLIEQLNDKISPCDDIQCAKENSINLIEKINQLLGAKSNWQHWCDINKQNTKISCPYNSEVVSFKLQKITERYLVQQFGFVRYYTNKIDYMNSREFYDLFLLSLDKNDVLLANEIPLTQHTMIIDEINDHINVYFQRQYQQKINQLMGEDVRPRLSIGQFTLLSSMQKIYQKALGIIYLEALPITLSRDQFSKQIVQPIYTKQQEYLSNKLASDSSWYEQDAPYAESGKSSLRSLVVPPVAIALSLIFGVLNLMSLLLNVIFLIIKENTLKRWLGFLMLVSAFVLTPQFNHSKIADQIAFGELLNHTQDDYRLIINVSQWMIKVEPMVYTIGNVLRVNVLDGFEFD